MATMGPDGFEEVVRLERMSYGSAAVGRLASGKAVFAEGGAPGDLARLRITEDKASFARAEVVELLEPGQARTTAPACAAGCGGCSWAHLSYDAQLSAKRAAVVDALVRTARWDAGDAEALVGACVPSKKQWGYRNKVELGVEPDGEGGLAIGLHEPGSNRVVPVDACPLAPKAIERAPRALRGALRFCLGNQDTGLYRIGVRHSLRTKATEVALWTPPGPFPRHAVASTLRDALRATSIVRVLAHPGRERKVRKVEVLYGAGCWEEELLGHRLAVSAPSFFQVNTAQAENLVRLALEGVGAAPGEAVADVYAGVGTFSLPLADAGCEVAAIEAAGSSVRDLRRNAAAAGADIEVIGGDAGRELGMLGPLGALVVDPPRCGLEPAAIAGIADAAPKRLAYVSCSPASWARDVGRLAEVGYELRSAVPVDMFPQTYHVEVVSIFEAADGLG